MYLGSMTGPMHNEAGLLQVVLSSPASDEPRERLSELWMRAGDPRGEFVAIQVKLARKRGTASELRKRARVLIERHGRSWAGEVAALVDGFYFRRGFVEHVRLDALAFLRIAEKLYKLAPIRHLTLTRAHIVASDLFSSPHLSRIVSLALDRCGLTDDDAIHMAESSHMAGIRWLSLGWNEISRRGLDAIASSEHLKSLQYLGFNDNLVPNPTMQPGGVDETCAVLDLNIPPLNRELRDIHGELPWLVYEGTRSFDWPPDRDI